jgi:hypothetical protein
MLAMTSLKTAGGYIPVCCIKGAIILVVGGAMALIALDGRYDRRSRYKKMQSTENQPDRHDRFILRVLHAAPYFTFHSKSAFGLAMQYR